MERLTASPFLIRFVGWMVATILTVSVFLFWSGGFSQLLEYLNDLF
jgi:hypothetical protein